MTVMKHKKNKHSALTDYQRQKKKARSLGYQTTEEYEKGLSVVQRLLAQKNKSDARNPQPVENSARSVEIIKHLKG